MELTSDEHVNSAHAQRRDRWFRRLSPDACTFSRALSVCAAWVPDESGYRYLKDRWHDPYKPREELARGIEQGVVFWGFEEDGVLLGLMGLQPVKDVTLIRHAYVTAPAVERASAASSISTCWDGPWDGSSWARGPRRNGPSGST